MRFLIYNFELVYSRSLLSLWSCLIDLFRTNSFFTVIPSYKNNILSYIVYLFYTRTDNDLKIVYLFYTKTINCQILSICFIQKQKNILSNLSFLNLVCRPGLNGSLLLNIRKIYPLRGIRLSSSQKIVPTPPNK